MKPFHSQDRHVVRLEWGPTGGRALTTYAAERGESVIAVVLDVLSFTTCVSVACDRGLTVYPYRWRDESAQRFAAEHRAELARPRSHAHDGVSLSPRSIRDAPADLKALVLPSPNGSTTSAVLAESGATVVAASLRNRAAVGHRLVEHLRAAAGTSGRPPAIVLVPAGERWPDDHTLRPSAEDLWGAGAVVEAVVARLEHQAGPLLLSPEAELALHAWLGVAHRVEDALAASASGRELIDIGWPDDVEIAAEVDGSERVPVLRDGAFVAAGLLADGRPEG
ncbi:hypothetical protein N865_05455 [Intrasporangium oryzae NRRL B-24470]|uniref:Probable 2-phosphosulfolactate phosphatase n=1 Tax=Intrasporangium oryzae NRRL B-24470 TaxID=1386089 RepID=W9GBI7_9MICO|nr:2-phosphosulfolactate phosphatase [Intrasporangium oryzae]EWT01229.1 hypothetical protein N865_05455 [Intrasporangium oryzae NRRL B-24470]